MRTNKYELSIFISFKKTNRPKYPSSLSIEDQTLYISVYLFTTGSFLGLCDGRFNHIQGGGLLVEIHSANLVKY